MNLNNLLHHGSLFPNIELDKLKTIGSNLLKTDFNKENNTFTFLHSKKILSKHNSMSSLNSRSTRLSLCSTELHHPDFLSNNHSLFDLEVDQSESQIKTRASNNFKTKIGKKHSSISPLRNRKPSHDVKLFYVFPWFSNLFLGS